MIKTATGIRVILNYFWNLHAAVAAFRGWRRTAHLPDGLLERSYTNTYGSID